MWCSVLSFYLYEEPKCGWTVNTTWAIVSSQVLHLLSNSKTLQFRARTAEHSQQSSQAVPAGAAGTALFHRALGECCSAGQHCFIAVSVTALWQRDSPCTATHTPEREPGLCMPWDKEHWCLTAPELQLLLTWDTASISYCTELKHFNSKRVSSFLSHYFLCYSGY